VNYLETQMKLTKSIFGYCVLVLLSLVHPRFAFGQTDTTSIPGKFDNYRQQVLQEKIYVHTDKVFYLAGEIIWFKIYCVEGTFHKPLNISKVAYVELLDNENKPALQAKIELKNGSGNGSLYLPVSVSSGNYKIRAYTNWMKNFSPEFYFEKNITVVNTLSTIVKSIQPTRELYDIQFFPEGGNLVQEIQSKVAFRVVGSNGHGINFAGTIVNENKEVIVSFHPAKFGLGNFLFTPETGHSYKAIIRPDGKDSIVRELPFIYAEGNVLSLSDNEDGTLIVKIRSNKKTNVTG